MALALPDPYVARPWTDAENAAADGHLSLVQARLAFLSSPQSPQQRLLSLAPYAFFLPNHRANEFMVEFGKGEKDVYVLSAGNAFSKSALLVNVLANVCYCGVADHLRDLPRYSKWPFEKRVWVVSEPSTLEEKISTEIAKWFPVGRYSAQKGSYRFPSRFQTDTGFEIILRSYAQEMGRFESTDVGLVLIDEPPPEWLWRALPARQRLGGVVAMFFTPMAGATWMVEGPWAFLDMDEDGVRAKPERVSRYFVMTGSTWDNLADGEDDAPHPERYNGGYVPEIKPSPRNGFLLRRNIDSMIAEFDADTIRARIDGAFMRIGRRIYPTFDRKTHVVGEDVLTTDEFAWSFSEKGELVPPNDWTRYMILDPHDAKPWAMLWVAVSPPFTGRPFSADKQQRGKQYESLHICYREWPRSAFSLKADDPGWGIDRYVETIAELEGREEIETRIIDPNFGNRTIRTADGQTTIKTMLQEVGLFFVDGYDAVEQGHQAVRTGLSKVAEVAPGFEKIPILLFTEGCPQTIVSMLNYSRKRRRGTMDEYLETPDEKFKDMADDVRYYWCAGMGWVPLELRSVERNKAKKKSDVDRFFDGDDYDEAQRARARSFGITGEMSFETGRHDADAIPGGATVGADPIRY